MFPLLARGFLLLGAWGAQEAPVENLSGQEQVQREDPATRTGRLESQFAGALVGARDHEDISETPGYRQLLETLANYGEAELAGKAVGNLDVAAALGNPGRWRGQILRVRALVVDIDAVRLAQPLGERVDVYRAFLSEADGSEHLVVDFLQEPPELDFGKDVVDLEGVFFRIVRWENEKGDYVYAPQLIARSLRKLDQQVAPRKTAFDGLALLTIGAAVAYLVVRILLSMRKQKSDPGARDSARAIRERANRPRPKPHP